MTDLRNDAHGAPAPPSLASTRPRAQSLPGCNPKPKHEDPAAPARISAILASPSYGPADHDLSFLASDALRGVRLQLDYEKAEVFLARHRIAHTIVVFGSTRVVEPAVAAARVAALETALARAAAGAGIARELAVARRRLANSRFYDEARTVGRLVGQAAASATGMNHKP